MGLPPEVRAVVLDIEGTTTPISFVYDTLFPYARARLDAVLEYRGKDARIGEALQLLRDEHGAESDEQGNVPPFGNGGAYARYLMEHDRKSTGLKLLQGLAWEEGYRSGKLRSTVFSDVPRAMRAWHEAGVRVRIYSSGSVLAQRLLFRHTDHGDLSHFIEGWHDTTTGPKREARSYLAITGELALAPAAVLFLSDSVAELDAARRAGLATGLLRRPGNPPVTTETHSAHADFDGLLPAAG